MHVESYLSILDDIGGTRGGGTESILISGA